MRLEFYNCQSDKDNKSNNYNNINNNLGGNLNNYNLRILYNLVSMFINIKIILQNKEYLVYTQCSQKRESNFNSI